MASSIPNLTAVDLAGGELFDSIDTLSKDFQHMTKEEHPALNSEIFASKPKI